MKSGVVLLAVTMSVVAGAQVSAHHSFTATYFEKQTITIEGKLVQILLRNPHSFVHVEATDKDGRVQRWAVEWAASGQLAGQGVTVKTLRVGDVVQVTGNPGRNPDDHRMRMVTLVRPSDGFGWGKNPGEVVR